MEHREPPRISMSEGLPRDATDSANARRFSRFVTPTHVRKLAPSRIGLAVVAGVSVLILVIIVGLRLAQSSVAWLHRQAPYQINAESIDFDPPIPTWYRGGKTAFLEHAKIGLDQGRGHSALDVDLPRLSKDLSLNYWVKGVIALGIKHPNRLHIHLQIRTPVAIAKLPDGTSLVIDEEGVLLPREEIDFEQAGPLVQLLQFGDAPKDRQPGLRWKREAGENELAKADDRIVAAAKLAAFIKRAQSGANERSRKPRFELVAPKTKVHGLVAGTSDSLWVSWGDAPGDEASGQPSAETKWGWVLDWIKQHGPADIRPKEYLKFSKSGASYP